MPRNVDPRNCSLLELVYLQTRSYRKTAKVVAFITAWSKSMDRCPQPLSIEDYAADWKVSRATAYRELKLFREAFPQLHDPTPVVDLMPTPEIRADARALVA